MTWNKTRLLKKLKQRIIKEEFNDMTKELKIACDIRRLYANF